MTHKGAFSCMGKDSSLEFGRPLAPSRSPWCCFSPDIPQLSFPQSFALQGDESVCSLLDHRVPCVCSTVSPLADKQTMAGLGWKHRRQSSNTCSRIVTQTPTIAFIDSKRPLSIDRHATTATVTSCQHRQWRPKEVTGITNCIQFKGITKTRRWSQQTRRWPCEEVAKQCTDCSTIKTRSM